jgi:hypothetical protein
MFKVVCVLNSLVTLPFAAGVLVDPRFTFEQFDLDLGPEGAGVARGYGAAALAWGLACALLVGSKTAEVSRAVLIASLAFNCTEVAVQVPMALAGVASPMIWTTIGAHALIAILSLVGLVRQTAVT